MKKFDNFCKALDNLEDIYKYEEPYDNVVLTDWWRFMKFVLNSLGRQSRKFYLKME